MGNSTSATSESRSPKKNESTTINNQEQEEENINYFNPSLQNTLLPPLDKCQFKFQLLSDIHLEFLVPAIFDENESTTKRKPITEYFSFDEDEIQAENLILAGDIGLLTEEGKQYQALEEFLIYCCSKFNRVFICQGNHHYYGVSIRHGDEKMRALVANKDKIVNQNLIFLNKDTYDVEGTDVRIIGCTLWSEITQEGYHCLNDFRKIFGLTFENFNEMHRDHAAWLHEESKKAEQDGKRVVILTHHAPCHGKGVTPKQNYEWEKKYGICGSDLIPNYISQDKTPAVKMCVFGHTHWTTMFECEGIAVVANQVGYPHEKLFKSFDAYVAPSKGRVYGI